MIFNSKKDLLKQIVKNTSPQTEEDTIATAMNTKAIYENDAARKQKASTMAYEVEMNRLTTQSTIQLSQAQMQEAASSAAATAANKVETNSETEQLMVKAGLITAEQMETGATIQASLADIQLAINSKAVTLAEGQQIATTLGLDAAQLKAAGSTMLLSTAQKSAAASTTLLGKALNLIKAHPVIATITAVAALVAITDALTTSEKEMLEAHEESVEKAKESISEYEELARELETIQQSYDDNKQKLEDLYKLRKNQTITQAEKDYLNELEGQNEKLKKQIEYKQSLADIEAKEAEDDAVKTLKEKTQNDLTTASTDKVGRTTYDKITDAEKIKQNTGTISGLTNYLIGFEKVIKGVELSQEDIDRYTAQLDVFQKKLDSIKGDSYASDQDRELYQNEIDLLNSLLNGTLTYEQYDKVTSSKTSTIEELISKNEELLQKVEPLNEAIKSTSGENYELKKANDEIIASAKDATVKFNEYTNVLNNTSDALSGVSDKTNDITVLSTISETVEHLGKKVKPVLDSLSSAYQDIFTDDGFTLENVGVDMLNSVKDAIAEINEIDGIDIDSSAFEDFTRVLSTTEITMDGVKTKEEEVHDAFNNLVTDIINGTDSTFASSDAFNTLVQSLKEMGVTNADEALTEIKKTQDQLIKQGIDINNITAEEAEAFLKEAEALGISTQWFKTYTLQKAIAENPLDTSEDIEALENLCNVLGVTGEMLEYVNAIKYANQMIEFKEKTGMGAPIEAMEATINSAKEKIQKLLDEGSVFEFDFEFEYDGNKAGGKGSDKDKDSTLDWVEIAVTRAEETLNRLNTAVDNTYSNWTNRSNALKEAIEDTSYAIGLQKQAYETYLAKANSVNLPEYLKERVRLGDMSIQDHVNSDTKELIDEYSEWYNKALDAKKAQEELNQTLNELNTTKQVDMIEEYYDALNEAKENGIEKLQNKIDMAEAQGFFANNSYYDGIESMLEEEIRIVAQKKANLDKVLSDNANLKGTAAYTELENLVTSVSNELDELYIKIEENKNSAQENEWNYFDYLRESISRVIDEADYLIELLSGEDLFDDSGNLTKYADATLALHGSNYEVYMANAKEYAEEVKALEKDLAEGKDVVDRYNEMVDAHQDAVLAAQKEKQAILDLVEEGYKAQLDALNELIDKKKEAMNAEKDLYDYQKSIKEKTQARDSLRRQLEVYKNDTSEEGLAQAQKLSVELKKAEDDLAETEYEKMLSDQEAMLDALSTDYEEWMNERLDNEDTLLTEIKDKLSEKGDEINATLTEVSGQYGSTLSTSLTTIFGEKPFDGVTTAINNLIAKIDGYVGGNPGDSKVSGSSGAGADSGSSGNTSQNVTQNTTSNNTNNNANTVQKAKSEKYTFIDKKSSYDKNKLAKETSIVDRLKYYDKDSSWDARAKYYSDLGGSGTYTGSATQNRWLISKMKENGFAKGGTIGNLIKRTGEDGFILARTGEEILSLEKIEALRDIFEKINPAMPNLNLTKVPTIQRRDVAQNVSLGGITIEQVVANNPQEFVQQLKTVMAKDQNVQKMVQEISFGQGLGNNTMSVKKYL